METICKKVNDVLAFLRRSLYNSNQQIRNQAYMLYIRPISEYVSTVWAPCAKLLEATQRCTARFVVSCRLRSWKEHFGVCFNSLGTMRKIIGSYTEVYS